MYQCVYKCMYNVDFTTLKIEFSEYLQKLGLIPETENEEEVSGVSIFEYREEFKEFIQENYNIDMESEDFSTNLSDLMETEIEDGKLVLSDEEAQNKDMAFMVNLLNGLFEDEEFAKSIDEDGIEGLNEEEIKKFLTFVSSQDDDEETLTFDEIADGYKKVEDGEYDVNDIELEEKEEIEEAEEETVQPAVQSSGGNSGGGYSGGGNSGGGNNVSNTQTTTQDDPKTLDRMTTQQLNDEYDKQKVNVDNHAQNVNNVIAQNNENVLKAKEEYDSAINADENISPELLNKRNTNLDEITKTDSTISQLKTEINDIDVEISACDSELSSIESSISALNASVSSFSNASSDDSEAQQEIKDKKEEIDNQLLELQVKQKEVREKKAQLEQQKAQKQEELDQNAEKLNTLNLEKASIDEEILANANEQTKNALNAYNQARANADTSLKTAQDNLKTEKDKLSNIEKYLNASKSKDIQDKYSYSPTADIFKEVGGYNWDEVVGQTKLKYGVISPNEIDPNKKMPLLIYLHGTGHEQGGLDLMEQRVFGEIFSNYKQEDFNGYVLCPNLTSGTWQSEDSARAIEEVISNFAKTHNIDEDNIALVGHSFGGSGALFMANSETFNGSGKYQLKKAAALTGYPAKKYNDYKIPVTIYEDADSHKLLKERAIDALNEQDGDQYFDYRSVEHGLVDNVALTKDKDGNGRADLFEWLYGK